jgi:hypothetical protein
MTQDTFFFNAFDFTNPQVRHRAVCFFLLFFFTFCQLTGQQPMPDGFDRAKSEIAKILKSGFKSAGPCTTWKCD